MHVCVCVCEGQTPQTHAVSMINGRAAVSSSEAISRGHVTGDVSRTTVNICSLPLPLAEL